MTFITAGSVFAAMKATVRKYESSDEEAVVGLSLRAWEPVFDAVEEILGRELLIRLRGDWRSGQATEVRAALASSGQAGVGDRGGHRLVSAIRDASRHDRNGG